MSVDFSTATIDTFSIVAYRPWDSPFAECETARPRINSAKQAALEREIDHCVDHCPYEHLDTCPAKCAVYAKYNK